MSDPTIDLPVENGPDLEPGLEEEVEAAPKLEEYSYRRPHDDVEITFLATAEHAATVDGAQLVAAPVTDEPAADSEASTEAEPEADATAAGAAAEGKAEAPATKARSARNK